MKRGRLTLLALAISAAFWAIAHFGNFSTANSEAPYHLAIARAQANEGITRQVPQLPHLGWDKYYADESFLYHQLLALGWRIGEAEAAQEIHNALAALSIGALAAVAAAVGGSLLLALGLAALLFANPQLLLPWFQLGPTPLWTILFATAAIAAQLGRRSWYGPLFALLGWAAPIPYAGLAFLWIALLSFFKQRPIAKELIPAALGFVVATFLHPYFPANILDQGLPPYKELLLTALTSKGFVEHFLILTLLLPLACVAFARSPQREPHFYLGAFFFSLLAAFQWHFLLPVALTFAVALGAQSLRILGKQAHGFAILAILLLLQSGIAYRYPYRAWELPDLEADIKAIPQGASIFNCDEAAGSQLLLQRPDLKIVDVLHRKVLETQNPTLAVVKANLLEGKVAHTWRTLRELVPVDYILCHYPLTTVILERSPGVERVSKTKGLFRVDAQFPTNFVKSWETKQATGWAALPASAYHPFPIPSNNSDCKRLRPQEIKAFLGSTHLALGGGPLLRLWWNGQPLARARLRTKYADLWAVLVPLPKPLQPSDALELEVCALPKVPYYGVALSFWTKAQVIAHCKHKAPIHSALPGVDWNCIAPLAYATSTEESTKWKSP